MVAPLPFDRMRLQIVLMPPGEANFSPRQATADIDVDLF
jgi:hypothetical protein